MAASSISGPQAGPPMSVSDIYANARALSGYLGSPHETEYKVR
jgi:hypothetical protein